MNSKDIHTETIFNNWILMMVMENPMQFTIVRAAPFEATGAV
jgi:hypothetical protein